MTELPHEQDVSVVDERDDADRDADDEDRIDDLAAIRQSPRILTERELPVRPADRR